MKTEVIGKKSTDTVQKQRYEAPQVEVIEMETEGNACIVGSLGQVNNGGSAFGNAPSSKARRYNAASSNELEDLINDILTIEK